MSLIDLVVTEDVVGEEEFVVVTWFKREGDSFNQDDILVIIQAEKISFEIPAPASGRLDTILVEQDGIAQPNQPLARITVIEREMEAPQPAATAPTPTNASSSTAAKPTTSVRASPIAKRLAREHNIDLTTYERKRQRGGALRKKMSCR